MQVAKLYSPLFVSCICKGYHKKKTARGIKKRSKERTQIHLKAVKMALAATKVGVGNVSQDATDPGQVEEETWQENLNMHLICPDCKEVPPKLVEEFSSGDMVCGDCGLVLGARIVDTRSEWRTFSNDDQTTDDPSRVGDGPNVLLNGDQLATSIAFDAGSKGARDLTRAQNRSTQDKGNKALLAAYKEITAMADANNMTRTVADHAKHLFKMTYDANIFRGKSQETVIAGCIFIACRQCKVPRTFREVFAMTKVSKKEIGRIYKALENFFKDQNNQREGKGVLGPCGQASPADLFSFL